MFARLQSPYNLAISALLTPTARIPQHFSPTLRGLFERGHAFRKVAGDIANPRPVIFIQASQWIRSTGKADPELSADVPVFISISVNGITPGSNRRTAISGVCAPSKIIHFMGAGAKLWRKTSGNIEDAVG